MTTATRPVLAAELQALVSWIETVTPVLRDATESLTASGEPLIAEVIRLIASQAERNASHAAKILAAK